MTTAKTTSITAQKREISKSAIRAIRNSGRVPGIMYGHKKTPVAVSLDSSEILKTYRTAGHSSLITLDVEGEKTQVLIHEVTVHPVKNNISHVDFFAVNLKEKTTVEVPLVFTGESLAIKNLGAILIKEQNHINVRCLPTEIPNEIIVNIEGLKVINDQIKIKDLKLDSKYETVHMTPETVLCSAVAPKVEKVDTSAPVTAEVPAAAGAPVVAATEEKKDGPKKEVKKEAKK